MVYTFKLFLLFIIISLSCINAQQWFNVRPIFNPSLSRNTHNGYFIDKKNGWWSSVYPGSVWRTTNEGNNWSILDSSNIGIGDIKFSDSLHGWTIGQTLPPYKYFISITKDGGKNWIKYSSPLIYCITFFDSLNGFAGGWDSIYATTDGGMTWKPQANDSGASFDILDIYFVDKNNGWAVGAHGYITDSGIILKTTNGGKYWSVNQPVTEHSYKTYFTDKLHGYVVGSAWGGTIKITKDGGVTWHTTNVQGPPLYDIKFTNDSTGWAVGQSGYIWNTMDRGVNWKKIESGSTSHLYNIFFFDNGKTGYIFGDNKTLLKYDNTVGVIKDYSQNIEDYALSQNFPNPFNPTTNISFSIPTTSFVSLKIYDALGRIISTLCSEKMMAGRHERQWNASQFQSGVYFYRLQVGSFSETKKLILLR